MLLAAAPASSSIGRPSARPQPFVPEYHGSVPSGQGMATMSGAVYDPVRPPIGRNTVNVMDGGARQALTQSPKGDNICPAPYPKMWMIEIGGQPKDRTWHSTSA